MTGKATKTTKKKITSYKPEYALKDFLELQENKEAFFVFVQHFLKPSYSAKWNRKLDNATGISSIVTVSDEAFVFLVLENNWNRWLDINKQSKNKYVPSKQGSRKPIVSDVLLVFTNVNGAVHRSGGNREVNRRWTEAGIL